jgi:tetratricopeptide (TPR) repeat protein
MRIVFHLAAIAFAAIVMASATLPVQAQSREQAIKDCDQERDPDRRISGCTQLIKSGTLSARQQSFAYNSRGNAWRDKDDNERAIPDYDEAIRLNPTYAHPYLGRGNANRELGEFDRALADYNEAIRLDPRDPYIYHGRANVWVDRGEFDRAIADETEALNLDPKYSESYSGRAIAWSRKGEFDRALRDHDEAVRLAPKEPRYLSSRGATWRLRGDLERSLADLNQAIRLAPDHALALTFRGDTFRYLGQFDRALADYDRALRGRSQFRPAFVGKGLTYERMGDLKRARAEFEKAVASTSQLKADVNRSALETARARLAAFDSGAPQPVIPAAPSRASLEQSIPTPAIAVPAAVPATVKQGRRVALIIGNAGYRNAGPLKNPQNDAQVIAASLRRVGFETVSVAADATREKMVEVLRAFRAEADRAEWAVVYYSGHGMEVNGMNYLIPVDARIAVDRDIQFEAVPLDQVMAVVEGASKLKLVLLDACRDNPFASQMKVTARPETTVEASTAGGTVGTRSVGRGLGAVKVSGATLVVYAAKHGQTALDGEGNNSPFAIAMVQRLATPNVEINKLFRLVRDDVMEATAGRQEPYTYGSLPGREDFFFVQR